MAKIIRAWETPRNEGTGVYDIGECPFYAAPFDDRRWIVGKLVEACDENNEQWLQVYDTDGRIRLVLPSRTHCFEFCAECVDGFVDVDTGDPEDSTTVPCARCNNG